SAWPGSTVSISGHGFGHGRGLSQYGSVGYAVNSGWSWQQILDHYYGGTSAGSPSPDYTIGVRIVANDGIDMIMTSGAACTVGGQSFGANTAARVRKIGSNNFAIESASGCGGPWTQIATAGGPVTATSTVGSPGNNPSLMLSLCQQAGVRAVYGTLAAV